MSDERAAMFHLEFKGFHPEFFGIKEKKLTPNVLKLTKQNVKSIKAASHTKQKQTLVGFFSVVSTNICVDGCC